MTVEVREYDHDNGTYEVVGLIRDGKFAGRERIRHIFEDVDLTDEEYLAQEMLTGPHLRTVRVDEE